MASLSAGILAPRPTTNTVDLVEPPPQHALTPRKPPAQTLLNSESLRDHLFSPSSSQSRSRHNSPSREPKTSGGPHSATAGVGGRKFNEEAVANSSVSNKRGKGDNSQSGNRRLQKARRRSTNILEPMEPPVLSFYGAQPVPLPSRFGHIKRRLAEGHHDALRASWTRLLSALADEMQEIQALGPALIPIMDFDQIDNAETVRHFGKALKRFGVGIIRGVVPPADAASWVAETRAYLDPNGQNGHSDIRPSPPQDPTCFEFFWTPAQIRSRAHPNVLRAMKFAMKFWAAGEGAEDPRMASRFPISYADRIRIHVRPDQVHLIQKQLPLPPPPPPPPSASSWNPETRSKQQAKADAHASAQHIAADTITAQVDGGSLERWELDGYGRCGTYDAVFEGRWEDYDPWDPTGRVQATPDLYNGAGACSLFRMYQGLLALTDVTPGMLQLLPSPKLVTVYFLLRPFFKPKMEAPTPGNTASVGEWDAFLADDNWSLEEEPSTIIHGAVPGHAQRVTELWHPHLQLRKTLVTPPSLKAGDYVLWHSEIPYTISSSDTYGIGSNTAASTGGANSQASRSTMSSCSDDVSSTPNCGNGLSLSLDSAPLMVYLPACPLTQTNALYLARQRKAFLRGHPGPDFDSTGSGLGSEADHMSRLGEKEIESVGGVEALRAMGLAPWDVGDVTDKAIGLDQASTENVGNVTKSVEGNEEADDNKSTICTANTKSTRKASSPGDEGRLSQAELELVRLANIILFPDKYEFYMPTRHNSPTGR